MNREQRRNADKPGQRLVVSAITVSFEDGSGVNLDPSKVMIIDRTTKKDLFKAVIQKDK